MRRRREEKSFRNLYEWKGFSSFCHIFFNVIFLCQNKYLMKLLLHLAHSCGLSNIWEWNKKQYHFLLSKTLKYPFRDFGHLPFDHLTSYGKFHEWIAQQSFVKHTVLCYESEVTDSWKLLFYSLLKSLSNSVSP